MHAVGAGLRPAGQESGMVPKKLDCGVVVFCGGALERDGDCRSADAGRSERGGRFSCCATGPDETLAAGGVVIQLRSAAGGLVCVALLEDRLPLRQSGVFAL